MFVFQFFLNFVQLGLQSIFMALVNPCKIWILVLHIHTYFSIASLVELYTANLYRGLQGVYGEIRVRGFQIYGDCMLLTIPAKIICKVKKKRKTFSVLFKFPNNFCRGFRLQVIPIKFICMLQGTLCDTGISYTF